MYFIKLVLFLSDGANVEKKPGTKHRNRVDPKQLQRALEAVRKGMTQVEASNQFKISKSVLNRRVVRPNTGDHIGPISAISPDLEKMFVRRFITCADWGYPFEMKEIQKIIADYLKDNKIIISKLTNNVPGIDYVRAFVKRHQELSHRIANNIKRSRAAVDFECLKLFFDNIKKDLEGVPSINIFNYDETNFTDDPGLKKVICRKTSKYTERVMNTTKTSTSVMFAASAAGDLLPPYVVYKASHLYNTWVEGGPKGTRYNRSKSGWFDSISFLDWLETIVVPNLRRLEGDLENTF